MQPLLPVGPGAAAQPRWPVGSPSSRLRPFAPRVDRTDAAHQQRSQRRIALLQPLWPPRQRPVGDHLVQRPKPGPPGGLRVDRLDDALPYRLIQMYSVYGDTVFDPFVGTGTTSLASAISGRNSIGVDVEESPVEAAAASLLTAAEVGRERTDARLLSHLEFVANGD